jgi:hypothetical protein
MRMLVTANRGFCASAARFGINERANDTAEEHRKHQTEKPLNPHVTNTNSTIADEFPTVGVDKSPPEFISSVNGRFTPKDAVPENTERMTGGTQKGGADAGANAELGVGEIEGGSFRVEPLRRLGEDANTMRARLLCPFLQSCFFLCCICRPSNAHNCHLQTRAVNGVPSKVTSSSPPSQTQTSPQ